jgi:hypothetical protein
MSTRFIDRIVLAALLLGLSSLATAGIVYDNGGPDQAGGGMVNNYSASADDFVLIKQTNIVSAKFWTLEQFQVGTTPGSAWTGYLQYFISADNNGVPGEPPLVASNGQNVVKQATGNTNVMIGNASYAEFEYSFDTVAPGVNLAAGTYWLVLQLQEFNTPAQPGEILWESTASDKQSAAQEFIQGQQGPEWVSLDYDLAFVLYDEDDENPVAVPLPATFLLLLPFLGFLGFRARRLQRGRT